MAVSSDQSSACEENGFSNEQQLPELLKAKEDNYDGVIVEIDKTHNDVALFVSALRASLSQWKTQGKKGVWIKVPLDQAKFVPAITEVEKGFRYHHAEATYSMLVYWIPQTPSTIPANASHYVGISAFVFNDKGEMLAVQEKSGPYRNSGLWKMPTGTINQLEDIYKGAIREVKEETGIDTEFIEVVGFRQSHSAPFGKSDLNFVCMLKSLSSDIVVQDTEILAAKWMTMAEFGGQPKIQQSKLQKEIFDVCVANFERRYKGFWAIPISSNSNRPSTVFYCNNLHDEPVEIYSQNHSLYSSLQDLETAMLQS